MTSYTLRNAIKLSLGPGYDHHCALAFESLGLLSSSSSIHFLSLLINNRRIKNINLGPLQTPIFEKISNLPQIYLIQLEARGDDCSGTAIPVVGQHKLRQLLQPYRLLFSAAVNYRMDHPHLTYRLFIAKVCTLRSQQIEQGRSFWHVGMFTSLHFTSHHFISEGVHVFTFLTQETEWEENATTSSSFTFNNYELHHQDMPPKNKVTDAASGGRGKKEDPASGSAVSAKNSKSLRASAAPVVSKPKLSKEEKAEQEQRRRQERDAMFLIPSALSDDEEEMHATQKKDQEPPVDKFGNTISKADAKKAAEDSKIEALRAEARARRQAKEEKQQREHLTVEGAPAVSGHVFSKLESSIEELRAKVESGAKLSHKESKLLTKIQREEFESNRGKDATGDELTNFSLSVQGERGQSYGDEEGSTLSAVDVIVNCFSIAAPGRPLLVDAKLKLVMGRRYGLLGPNGRGKTTLLKYLAATSRPLPLPAGVDVHLVQQEVEASDEPVVQQVLDADRRRSDLMSEQSDLLSQFDIQESLEETDAKSWTEETWSLKLARFAQVGELLEAIGADASEAKVRRILTGLGFSEQMQDSPSRILSGGWRMRVALACALYLEPKLLLLDEPTNHLDLNAVLWLESYLATSWAGRSLVVVSHDAAFLEEVCTDIIHLDEYKLNYYAGSYWAFVGLHDQIQSKKLQNYEHEQKVISDIKKSGIRADRVERKALQQLNISVLTEKPKEYRVRFLFQSPGQAGGAIDLRGVSFSFEGSERQLFSNLTTRIDTTSRVAVVGPNGAGKSSLLRLFAGSLEPSSGEILRNSKLSIGVYNQHFEELLPKDLSPVEYLMKTYNAKMPDARKYLGMFGLDGQRHLIKMSDLSGGQKARVVFASLSFQCPHILILDEPTNHLDMESVDALVDGVNGFVGGVVLVSHDSRLIKATNCELWVCGDSASGLRSERGGFEKYERDVMCEIDRQASIAAERANARAAQQKADREARFEKMKREKIKKGRDSTLN